jgi:guanylate kinase
VLIDIDTAGAAKIRSCGDSAISDALADVFLMPPGLEELNRRLRSRGTESDEQVALRIANAAAEMRHWHEYRYTLLSGTMEKDFEKFRAVMSAERSLSRRMRIPPL